MRIAQILNERIHWIFEAETMPQWPPDQHGNPIVLVDATDIEGAQEGEPWPIVPKQPEKETPTEEEESGGETGAGEEESPP